TGRIDAKESLEHARLRLERNAGALVDDADRVLAGALAERDGDGAAIRRMLDGIVEEIEHEAAELVGVALERGLDEFEEAHLNRMLGGEGVNDANRRLNHFVEMHELAPLADVAGIGPREEKEIVDDAGESASGVAHDGDRGAVRLFRAMRLRQRDVG